MIEHVNEATIVGELANEPEVRSTRTGRPVGNLFVVTRRSWMNRDGRHDERSDYHRVTCWGEYADVCRALRKGDGVRVVGRLQTRSYTDRQGAKKFVTEVIASELEPLNSEPSPPARVPSDELDDIPF